MAAEVMRIFAGVGMFCIEMFVQRDGRVLVNEIAPRPHNSGHYTIEACYTNQFENHIRAITGLPLGSTQLKAGAAMMNLLGRANGPAWVDGAEEGLKIPGVTLHVYGKSECRKGRKMGHLTAVAPTAAEAAEKAETAFTKINITARN